MTADKVIVEINESLPMGLMGMHDFFEIGLPPHAKIIPVEKPDDRIGTPYIPCPPEKIAAIVITNLQDQPQKFRPIDPVTEKIGENIVNFLKGEIAAGRLPENPGPIQSGVGAVGNAVLSCLESSGFKGLSMYTEVMQDSAFELLSKGVFDFISTSSIALTEENKKKFYENIDFYRDKIIVRPNEISNHPEVIRRLGVIALNTPIEADIYGNINSTHLSGTRMMNGLGGSGDFTRNARISIFATESIVLGVTLFPASFLWFLMWIRPNTMCVSSLPNRVLPICAGRRQKNAQSLSLKTARIRIIDRSCGNISDTQ